MVNIEEMISGIDRKHVCYQEKDFMTKPLRNKILKKSFKGLMLVSLFSICAFGITKNPEIKQMASLAYETLNEGYESLGLSKNFSDIATFATFAIPLYLLARKKS